MTIGVAKELHRDESRLAMAPQSAKDLQKLVYECLIEKGAGVASGGPTWWPRFGRQSPSN